MHCDLGRLMIGFGVKNPHLCSACSQNNYLNIGIYLRLDNNVAIPTRRVNMNTELKMALGTTVVIALFFSAFFVSMF